MLGEYSSVLFCSSEDEGLCVPDRRSEMLPGVIQLMSGGMAGNVELSLQDAYEKPTFSARRFFFLSPFPLWLLSRTLRCLGLFLAWFC